MMLAQMLKRAEARGVTVLAYDMAWQADGTAHWGKRLPVLYGAEVGGHGPCGATYSSCPQRAHWDSKAAGNDALVA